MRKASILRGFLTILVVVQGLPLRAEEPAVADRAQLQQRLDAKLEELAAVQREVEQLQRELNCQPQLMVHLKMFEVNRTKLRNLGIEFAKISGAPERGPDDAFTAAFKQPGFVEALVHKNVARLVADPTVVTLVGRRATFHQGGEIPVAKLPDGQLKYESFGTGVEVLGTLAGDDRIKLDIQVRQADLDESQHVEIDGKQYPGLRVREVQTSLQVKSGEAFVIPGLLEERVEASLRDDGSQVSTVNQIQSMMLVTLELLEALPEVSTVHLQGPQRPQPARTYDSPGGVPWPQTAPLPVLLQDAIEINVSMMELSLTKLRNLGHEVNGAETWIKVFGLEERHAANQVVDGYTDVIPFTASADHGLAIEKQIAPLVENGALRLVGQPRLLTRSGEAGLVELTSPGTQIESRAVPAAVVASEPHAIQQRTPANEPVAQPVAASSPLGYRLEMTPTLLDLAKRDVELSLNLSLCEPPASADAKPAGSQAGLVVSKTERKLHLAYGQCVIFPGPRFQRGQLDIEGNRKQETLEEIVPVYLVLAIPKQVPVMPTAVAPTAAEPTLRK